MPIYEYRCSACRFEKDALQKMSDAALVDCPSCGKPTLVKLISAAGFQLKGSGWYATDFKNSGSAKAADKAKPVDGAAAKEGSANAKTDTGGKESAGGDAAAAKPAAPAAKSDGPAPSTTTPTGTGD